MKRNKSNQSGAVVAGTLLAISWLALALSVAKGGEVIYDKVQTNRIVDGIQEQVQYLTKQAPNLGKSGDLAVQESLRLLQVSKDIEREGLRSYSSDLLKEGVGLSLGTVLGTAGKIGEGIGHVMNILGVKDNVVGAASGDGMSESDLKFWEMLKGSRDNVDLFELARHKAEIDEIARMRGELKDAGSEIDALIARQEQANAYREQLKARAEQRRLDRLEALKNQEVQKELEEPDEPPVQAKTQTQTPKQPSVASQGGYRGVIKAVLSDYKNSGGTGAGIMKLETGWDAVNEVVEGRCKGASGYETDSKRVISTEIKILEMIPFGLNDWNESDGCVDYYVGSRSVIKKTRYSSTINDIKVCQNTLYFKQRVECSEDCSSGPYGKVIIGSRFFYGGHQFIVETTNDANPAEACTGGEIPGQHMSILKSFIGRIK
ncbi:MAG: hypothetical protein KAR00_01320 [Candidatus Pacebacteria bacterium]|nr:hypothetical protein [Candidatus Paceibacterota bacterium]